jgi:hypothetical protein
LFTDGTIVGRDGLSTKLLHAFCSDLVYDINKGRRFLFYRINRFAYRGSHYDRKSLQS